MLLILRDEMLFEFMSKFKTAVKACFKHSPAAESNLQEDSNCDVTSKNLDTSSYDIDTGEDSE